MIVSGLPIIVAFVVLVVSAFIPVIYSFVHYKSLEREGHSRERTSPIRSRRYDTSWDGFQSVLPLPGRVVTPLIDPSRDLVGAGFARARAQDMVGSPEPIGGLDHFQHRT